MKHGENCIRCGEELVTWERTRSECWNCREATSVTYYDVDFQDQRNKKRTI